MESGKKRSANYTTAEESLLVLLVKKYKHIIENKKTDTTTMTQQNDVWIKIEKEFNGESGQIYRNALVLKKKYENIKERTKKKIADEKCFRKVTGGGPDETFQFNTLDSNVMELLGDARIAGLPAQFGSDADYPKKDLQEAKGNSNLHRNPMKDHSFGENTTSWAKYTPQMLRTPKSRNLVPDKEQNGSCSKKQRQTPIVTKVSQWANAKAELDLKRKQQIDEEHTLKLKLMK
ncbi:hypothetical protein JTB14_027447 [Gonioctena quinquepunctata]|nr:hypothetical protein JTB14_027447 [Gonioctena quinquepunctata]